MMEKTDAQVIALADLSAETPFRLTPETAEREAIAKTLGFSSIRKLNFEGRLVPVGSKDWSLHGHLGATIVQPCSVTLAPVTTRIDTNIQRLYQRAYKDRDTAGEFEMDDDDSIEALPATLDLSLIMTEALAIAAPDFPRADGAELETSQFAAPGVQPLSDEDTKPFSALKALKDKLAGDDSD